MARARGKRDGDTEFYVYLTDKDSQRRVAVGNFWARTSGEAIGIARKVYPGFFNNCETGKWIANAESAKPFSSPYFAENNKVPKP